MYYLGYINYMEHDFGGAIPLFEEVGKDSKFAESCKYYILESKFMLKDYDYVNTTGKEVFQQLGNNYKARARKLERILKMK